MEKFLIIWCFYSIHEILDYKDEINVMITVIRNNL
jgi:hypothetical protein